MADIEMNNKRMVQQVGKLSDLDSILKVHRHVVVDFFATWCGPCVSLAPKLEKLATANPTVTFLKVDVEKAKTIADKYRIRAMPTLLYFADGKLSHSIQGADDKAIKAALDKLVKK
jgi:thioredoxin 1